MATETATATATFGVPYDWAFVDDRFVPSGDARLGILANALSYGTGTFEGIRAYWNDDRQELFLLDPAAHYERMGQSAHILGLRLPHPVPRLVALTCELLRRNGVRANAYIRPLLLLGEQRLFVRMDGIAQWFCIAATPVPGDYISSGGVRCMVSSWRRSPDLAVPNRAKVIGSYVGPALAKTEALAHGFDEAILLTGDGYVAEASTSNIVVRRGDQWATPPASDDVLEGITLRQVRTLLREEYGATVTERRIHRSELYICDEVLLCGTAAGVVPVTEVDGRTVGGGIPGAAGLAVQQILRGIARGTDPRHPEWVTPVYSTQEDR